jgi:hypothetical protein
MELQVLATRDALSERDEFESQMKGFIREEYGHILGDRAAILDGPRGLELFMAKYWGGLSDREIDEEMEAGPGAGTADGSKWKAA